MNHSENSIAPDSVEDNTSRITSSVNAVWYYQGQLVTNPKVITIFWGSSWEQSFYLDLANRLNTFFDFILKSTFMNMLGQYSVANYIIGYGSRESTVTITNDEPAPLMTSDDVIGRLEELIYNKSIPSGTDYVYFVYLPKGVKVKFKEQYSCSDFCSYHYHAAAGMIRHVVIPYPDCDNCKVGSDDYFNRLTSLSSKELAGVVTDPDPFTGWCDTSNKEIKDICAGNNDWLGGYWTQKQWSNNYNTCILGTKAQKSAYGASIAVYGSNLICAFVAADKTRRLIYCISSDGIFWKDNSIIEEASPVSPCLATWNNFLYVGFLSKNWNENVLLCSYDGATWTKNVNTGPSSGDTPALAGFNNELWLVYRESAASDAHMHVIHSTDGKDWSSPQAINQQSQHGGSMVVFNNELWLAFVAYNADHHVLLCHSSNGLDWSDNINTWQQSATAPSIVVFKNKMVIAFVADNNSGDVLVISSEDGYKWSADTKVSQLSSQAPALAVFQNKLWLCFVSDDDNSTVLICYSEDGLNWSTDYLV